MLTAGRWKMLFLRKRSLSWAKPYLWTSQVYSSIHQKLKTPLSEAEEGGNWACKRQGPSHQRQANGPSPSLLSRGISSPTLWIGSEGQGQLHSDGLDFVCEQTQAEKVRIYPESEVSPLGKFSHWHYRRSPGLAGCQEHPVFLVTTIFTHSGSLRPNLNPQAEERAYRPHHPTQDFQEAEGRGRHDSRRGGVRRRTQGLPTVMVWY